MKLVSDQTLHLSQLKLYARGSSGKLGAKERECHGSVTILTTKKFPPPPVDLVLISSASCIFLTVF